jgi:hypothetical protein
MTESGKERILTLVHGRRFAAMMPCRAPYCHINATALLRKESGEAPDESRHKIVDGEEMSCERYS